MTATKAHRRPMQANASPQQPTTANAGQRRSTQVNEGQCRPTKTKKGPNDASRVIWALGVCVFFFFFSVLLTMKAHSSQRRPTTANAGQRRPTAANLWHYISIESTIHSMALYYF